jgi:GrpB-like predicted nucleotidyltransferase (UPF0157 family)
MLKKEIVMRKINVVPYNLEWIKRYDEESRNLQELLGNEIINIFHIGSTSIPNMAAKPTIDILIEVKELSEIDKRNRGFQNLGYEPKGENGIPSRRYFQKGGDNRTHHVHIFPSDHEAVFRHLAFRDYLIENPSEAKRYETIKIELAKKFEFAPSKYSEGKHDLIQELEEKAKRWYLKK